MLLFCNVFLYIYLPFSANLFFAGNPAGDEVHLRGVVHLLASFRSWRKNNSQGSNKPDFQGWGAGAGRGRVFLAPWSRSRLEKKSRAGAGAAKNLPAPQPCEKIKSIRKLYSSLGKILSFMVKKTTILLGFIFFCSFTLLVCGKKNIFPRSRSRSELGVFGPLEPEPEPEPLEKKYQEPEPLGKKIRSRSRLKKKVRSRSR